MGKPCFSHVDLPPDSAPGTSLNLSAEGETWSVFPVHFGNPHAVLMCDNPQGMAQKYGALLSQHHLFPNRVNVNFCHVGSETIELVVFERGVGLTMACGSGACATALALVLAKERPRNQDIPIALPGGLLRIHIHEDDEVTMLGEAQLSFMGQTSVL